MYGVYKESVKDLRGRGFSSEEAFWIQFAEVCPCIVWDENAAAKVKLSEVLRLYLSIYCEQIKPEMAVDEEPVFLELLKERYDEVNRIVFESHPDNYGLATLELGRLILGENANIIRQIEVGMDVVGTACAVAEKPIPLKLVRDI